MDQNQPFILKKETFKFKFYNTLEKYYYIKTIYSFRYFYLLKFGGIEKIIEFDEIELTRIHLGQSLVIVKSLDQKVQQLQLLKIEHEYLDWNKIWLKFNDQNETFNCKYSKINNPIHFTGYQCLNNEINSLKKILIIIKYFFDNCFDNIILTQLKDDITKIFLSQQQTKYNKQLDQLIKEINNFLKNIYMIKRNKSFLFYEYADKINERRHEGKVGYSNDIIIYVNDIKNGKKFHLMYLNQNIVNIQGILSIVKHLNNCKGYQKIQYDVDKTIIAIEQIQYCIYQIQKFN
ncbi:unnamed protein product [Paramecium primaurelia]|uniref:Uncharacterized protein n=1 Tax=Paramecium primaurelia TaxID=5886 RepID=A0A8S1QFL0_PARPR|nr:unnamed protein product [Paramecium primaurelia]